MKTYAVDFETYYDNECSVKTLGNNGYFSHYAFDAYLVTVVGDDGYEYAGSPQDFDWSLLENNQVCSHNAAFDESLYLFGVSKGWYPSVSYKSWDCTADMTAYLGKPRSLKNACAEVFGIEVSKDTRDNMKSKRWSQMTDEFRKEVVEYALVDARLCLRLWQLLSENWPEFERQISRHTRIVGRRGLPIDGDELDSAINTLKIERDRLEQAIPWVNEATPLSRKAFNQQCRKQDIGIPSSMALGNQVAETWLEEHQQDCPWAIAVRDYRRVNSLLKKLESFERGSDTGRYYGGLLYFGATTGRFSGSGGNLNLQNLPRGEMFGVNMRKLLRTDDDHKFVISDLSQIEVRTLCWLAGDGDTLAEIEKSDDIYEAFAIRFGLWKPESGNMKRESPELRHKIKQIVLGAGYGASADKFALITGMSKKEAKDSLRLYKKRMPKVVEYWDYISDMIDFSVKSKQPMRLQLPSGRHLDYGVLELLGKDGEDEGGRKRQPVAMLNRFGKRTIIRIWHGLVTENMAQALARDVFSDIMLRIEKAGWKIVLHVHDEVVVEVHKDDAERAAAEIEKIMSTPPDWIPDIPLATEASIHDYYTK